MVILLFVPPIPEARNRAQRNGHEGPLGEPVPGLDGSLGEQDEANVFDCKQDGANSARAANASQQETVSPPLSDLLPRSLLESVHINEKCSRAGASAAENKAGGLPASAATSGSPASGYP